MTSLTLVSNNINQKIEIIKNIIKNQSIIIAYSGGVDSSLLAYFCKQYAYRTLLVMQIGISVSTREQDFAHKQAEQLGLPIKLIDYNESELSPEYSKNDENRCYYCKTILYDKINELKNELGYDLIINGTNASDLTGHRPGYLASIEQNVKSPFVEAGMLKHEIRQLAFDYGLLSANKPAMACLASRVVTGIKITNKLLDRIEKAEDYLMNNYELKTVRVRDHGNLARIELDASDLQKFLCSVNNKELTNYFKTLGYYFVTVDLEGYRPAIPH